MNSHQNTQRPVLSMTGITKSFPGDKGQAPKIVLDKIDFEVHSNQTVSIIGRSGSGKSTLLNILAGMDHPTSGTYFFEGKQVFPIRPWKLFNRVTPAKLRSSIGFVFQTHYMLENFTIKQNIELPLSINGRSGRSVRLQVEEMGERLGLKDHLEKTSDQVSGGQRQRAGIGRALIHNPQLIVADEPTGNLDSLTGREMQALLFKQVKHQGNLAEVSPALIVVTHDISLAAKCDRIHLIRDGKLFECSGMSEQDLLQELEASQESKL